MIYIHVMLETERGEKNDAINHTNMHPLLGNKALLRK